MGIINGVYMRIINKLNISLYVLMISASVGFYSNLNKQDSMKAYWILLFVVPLILLSIKNNKLFTKYKTKLVYWDMLFTIWVIVIPLIKLPNGLSRLIMAIGGFVYAYIVGKRKVKLMGSTVKTG